MNALQREGDTGITDDSTRMTFGSVGMDYRGERLRASAGRGLPEAAHQPGTADGAGDRRRYPGCASARHNYAQPWTYSMTENTFGMLRAEHEPGRTLDRLCGHRRRNHAREKGSYSSLTVNGDGVGTGSRMDVPYESDSYGMMSGCAASSRPGR